MSQTRFYNLITELAQLRANVDLSFENYAKAVAQKISQELNWGRVGVWLYDENNTHLNSVCIFSNEENKFLDALSLPCAQFPIYFKTITANRSSAFNDTLNDAKSAEFLEYFKTYQITSMLDAAMWLGNHMYGVVCIEHVGEKKVWSLDEIQFVGALADIIANSLSAYQQKNQNEQNLLNSKLATIGEFSLQILHEVANPLSVVQGSLVMAVKLHELGKHDDVLKYCKKSLDSINRISNTFKTMKNLSRSGENGQDEFTLKDILDDVEILLGMKLKCQHINIICNKNTMSFGLKTDRSIIGQVILNLLNNSLDAIENKNKKWIQVDAIQVDQQIIISVIDSGNGIPAEVREKLFKNFFTTKEEGKGTGIGLAFCLKALKKLNGELKIDTNHLNTKFDIIIPATCAFNQRKAA
jgi:signal transduction histidine kinase